MALGGRGLSSGRGASLVGSDTGLSSGIGGLQGIDVENGVHLNFSSNVHYTKAAGSPAVFAPFTSLFTFTRAAPDATYFDRAGVLRTATTNIPRINYTNGIWGGYLAEKSSTNVALNSADLSAGTWTKNECTISTASSIDGTTRNIRIVESVNNAIHGVIAGQTIVANSANCLSAIVRDNGRGFAYIYGTNTDQFGAIFNLTTLATADIIAGTSTISNRGIVPLGNGRFLVYVSGVLNVASTVINIVAGPATSLSVPAGYTYTGNGVSGVDIEYIQNEPGIVPTSRIPTAGSSVTRAADTASRTVGSEYSTTAGTILASAIMSGGAAPAPAQTVVAFNDGTTSKTILVNRGSTESTVKLGVVDTVIQVNTVGATLSDFAVFNVGATWAANDDAIVVNGGDPVVDGICTIPTGITTMSIGWQSAAANSQFNGSIRSVSYMPERLSNSFIRI